MKRSLLVLLLSFFCFSGSGQITLLDTDYPVSLLGVDSIKKTVAASPFPVISTLSGNNCDFSIVVDTTSTSYDYRVTSPLDFADSSLSTFAFYNYVTEVQSKMTLSELSHRSQTIFSSKYSITAITAGFNDSLYIPAQNAAYSALRKIIAFPATAGSNWNSDYNYDLNFELSIAAFSLDHDPGFQRRFTAESNNVIGWGRARVNDITGVPSPYFDVLQVQTETQTVDSFFLDGAPMPPVILSIFSLTQGKKDTTFEYNYYRKGEVTPLVKIEFKDAAYTQPFRGTTHVQRIFTNGVTTSEAPVFRLYPNPVTNGLINFRVPAQAGEFTYQLAGVDGMILATGRLAADNGHASIPVSTVPSGMYLLKIEVGSYIYNTCVQVN